ncbi:MAG: CHAT domain-containing protein [Spirulina sp. SIO3F2]|nr:CHAT domain-containing protein [Spirulina sp. SIO3F2]
MLKNLLRSAAIASLVLVLQGSLTPLRSQVDYYREERQQIVENFAADLAEARQHPTVFPEIDVWEFYADALLYLGQFEAAKEAAEEGLRLVRRQPPHRLESVRMTQFGAELGFIDTLADAHHHLGDPFGREFLEQQLSRPLKPEIRPEVLHDLILAYQDIKSTTFSERALGFAEEWVEFNRQKGDTEAIIDALRLLTYILPSYESEPWREIAVWEEALELARQLNAPPSSHNSVSSITYRLAYQLHWAGESDEALALLSELTAQIRQQVPNDTRELTIFLDQQSYMHRDLGNYAIAIKFQQESLHLGEVSSLAYDLASLSELFFFNNDFSQALTYQQQSHQVIKQVLSSDDPLLSGISLADSHARLGFLLLQADQLSEAQTHLEQALTLSQPSTQRSSFYAISDEYDVYTYAAINDIQRLLQETYLKQGNLEAALLASATGRSQGILQLLNTQVNDDGTVEVIIEPPTIKDLKKIAKREKTTLVQYSLSYQYPRYWRRDWGIWVRYAKDELKALTIWVISPNGEIQQETVPLIGLDLNKLIRTTRRQIVRSTTENRATESLQTLHQLLIKPIQAHLPNDPEARVTFIPDNLISLIPFAALQDANGVELIERHTILTAPSIQVLAEARRNQRRNEPRNRALVVGNPKMPAIPKSPSANRNNLSPLPGAAVEAKAIASLLDIEPLIGAQATETQVREQIQDAEILHFATHGLLEASSYANSLALTPSREHDGFLSVREIYPLELNAELAVLSACDTGNGDIYNGEGVIGLSRAFIGAGAASVVVSLWAIPDQPTSELMTSFYQQLDVGVDKATALRQAMLATREKFPAPSNWVAFTITGAVD